MTREGSDPLDAGTSAFALEPLPTPSPLPVSVDSTIAGQPIPTIKRLRLFSPGDWEEFVLEWAQSLTREYDRVERVGGAGDQGRDIVAFTPSGEWDNFQCKHYDHALYPTDAWPEIAKLMYWTFKGAFGLPRRYYFVAPQGVGTTLSRLLREPEELRAQLTNAWDGHCAGAIVGGSRVELEGALRAYVDNAPFSIFSSVTPLDLIEQHRKTPYHVARFGGGLPARDMTPPTVPSEIASIEERYVRQLLDAYSDHLSRSVASPTDIADNGVLMAHFREARVEFFSAEALRSFSRDTLPLGEFERLQDEFETGVADEARRAHPDGYERVLAVVRTARGLQITAHALIPRMAVRDRGGICHQLANDDRLTWVPER